MTEKKKLLSKKDFIKDKEINIANQAILSELTPLNINANQNYVTIKNKNFELTCCSDNIIEAVKNVIEAKNILEKEFKIFNRERDEKGRFISKKNEEVVKDEINNEVKEAEEENNESEQNVQNEEVN